jgi:putative ABC transport system permease protein
VLASGRYFQTLGVRPSAGRLLDVQDDDAAKPSVVLSDRLARRIARRPADVIGHAVSVNGRTFDVVGVVQPGFLGIESGHPADLWLPLSSEPAISVPLVAPDGRVIQGFRNTPDVGWLRVGLRRGRSDTNAAVEARLTPVLRAPGAGERLHPEKSRASVVDHIWLSPFSGDMDRVTSVVRLVIGAALMTMFLSTMCLAGVFAGRLADSARDIALRVAIGASRARLLRVAAIEIALVIVAGAAVALPASVLLLDVASQLQLATDLTVGDALVSVIDGRAIAMVLALAGLMAAVSAVAPLVVVWRLSRTVRVETTRATAGGPRLRRLLLVAQVATGCACLSGALLLTRSIAALEGQALGYDAAHVAFAELDPAGAGLDAKAKASIVNRLASAVTTDLDFAFADAAPYRDGGSRFLFFSAVDSAETRQQSTPITQVSARYFEVLGVGLVAGRMFTNEDAGQPVAILSEPTARHYWPNGDAVGQTVLVGGRTGVAHRVVGVVAGLRDASLKGQPGTRVYIPYNDRAESLVLLARKSGARPADVVRSLVDFSRRLDDRMVLIRSGSLLDLAWRTIEQRVLIRFVVMTIGLGSLVMIAAGVWGLSHSSLRRRWREFGVRRALGATTSNIRRLALGDALVVTTVGAAAGLAASWWIGALLRSWLFGVTEHDPLSIAGGVALVIAATLAGASRPTRDAGRLEPTMLLRDDQ